MVSDLLQWLNAAIKNQAFPIFLPCHLQCVCSNKHHILSKVSQAGRKGTKRDWEHIVSKTEFKKLNDHLYKPLG